MARVGWLGLRVIRRDGAGGRRLRRLRERHRLTVEIVADAVDLPRAAYVDIEADAATLTYADQERVEQVIAALAEGLCFVCLRAVASDGVKINKRGVHPPCWRERATSEATRQVLRAGASRRKRAPGSAPERADRLTRPR